MNIKLIKYTCKHKKAFLKIEKNLLGRNTISGYLHDLDKIFLYILPLKKSTVQTIHRKHARHHVNNKVKTQQDYIQMIIDWECARYTKSDKPLNARDTLYKFYPQLENQILPLLNKYNL